MKTILANLASLVVLSSTAHAGLEFKDAIDLDLIVERNPNSIVSAEWLDCADADFQAYLPAAGTKTTTRFKKYERRDGLRSNRVSDSFLRNGIKNADCISITVKGWSQSIDEQVDKAKDRVIKEIMRLQRSKWSRVNSKQLRDQKYGKVNYMTIKHPTRRSVKCSGNQFIDFSEKVQLWSINNTPSRSNVRDLTLVFGLEGKGKDYMKVSSGYGCRFLGETKTVEDIKLFGNFKDVAPLDPKEYQINFEKDYLN